MKEQLAPILQYLGRLRDRLKAVGYGEDDKIYKAAHKAHDAAFSLQVLMHSVSCGGIFFIDAHEKKPPAEESNH